VRFAAEQDDIEGREPSACLQHAPDLAVQPRTVGDVHRHVLQQHDIETAIVKGKLERAGGLERHLPGLSRAFGQIARGIHEGRAEVDAPNLAAIGRSQIARRPADA
jgi:hypothetical protein